jgi:ubiquitin carboxyl-terminal hydrolase 7
LNHKYINSSQGGKVFLEIKIRKNNSDIYNKEKEINNSSIIEILDSLTFNIEFNITYNSFRSHNNSLSNISYDTLYTTQEVIIPPEYYNNINNINALNEIPFVVELLVSKNFNNISKLDKGQYNGIKNEGATCYMNSMLQTLYSIHPFKKAVFQIPTDKDDNSSIVLSLQRLFYDLITNHSPVSARNLINSFGWTREQIQIQHDVQEFNQLLIEEMEKKMKGTSVEGSFNKMLTGKYNNYIQCIDFDYRSEIEEKFNEIQLTVKGYKNIYQSFDSYTAEEILDNENKYETEKYGKQKAKKE